MAMTVRERNILIAAVLAVGLLIGDRYVLTPVLNARTQTRQRLDLLISEAAQSQTVLKKQNAVRGEWEDMQRAGLTDDAEKTVSDVLRFLRDSSDRHRLSLSSIQPERLQSKQGLTEIDFTFSGTGTISAVTGFLWDIESVSMPLRIKSLGLGAGDEYASKMSVQIKMSSICIAPDDNKKETGL